MPSVLESVIDLLDRDDVVDHLGNTTGADASTVGRAAKTAAPALLGRLADRAEEPGGLQAVQGLLDDAEDLADDDLGRAVTADPRLGNRFLDGVVGDRRASFVSSLAGQAGVSSSIMTRLLPMVAPVIMGVLARRRFADNLGANGVAALLGRERAAMNANGLLGGRGGDVDGLRPTEPREPDRDRRGFGWLWPVLIGLGLLAALAIALSQCGSSDDAGDTIGGAVDGAGDALDDAGDAVSDAADGVGDAASDAADGIGDAIDDDELAAGVTAALRGVDADLDGVTTSVDDGVVTLTGDVATGEASQAAEAAVGAVEGVTSVDNRLTITGGPTATSGAPAPEDDDQPGDDPTINELLDLEPITFAVNSAELTAEGRAVLDEAVEYFAANPDVVVEIGGHTDADGDDASNLTLSQDRADAVLAYLADQGVDESRMTAVGYGETEPVAPNDTDENKARNRRIEFVVQ